MAKTSVKLIANNKKAYHDYFILEKYSADDVLLHGHALGLHLGGKGGLGQPAHKAQLTQPVPADILLAVISVYFQSSYSPFHFILKSRSP